MSDEYAPGPAAGADVRKDDGPRWTLVLVRELRHSPERVWQALVDPAQLREWAPYDSDENLGTTGARARLSTVGAPKEHVSEITVRRAEPPRLLEIDWAGGELRWQLEPAGAGTRLTLWTSIDRRFVSMGATGWHVCFDVLDRLLAGAPLGRIAGPAAMALPGWQRLHAEYAAQFGVEMPPWTPPARGGKDKEEP